VKEAAMASAGNIEFRNYCDSVYDELTDMKERLYDLVSCIEYMPENEKKVLHPHIRHLKDIANTIDWKLEIITKVCPADWSKYSKETDSPSVKVPEKSGEDFAGGYVGG
jgi:hypothetical protein